MAITMILLLLIVSEAVFAAFFLHLSAGGAAVWKGCLCGRVVVGRAGTSGASSRTGLKCGRGGESN